MTPTTFTATLQSVDGKRVAQGRDFTSVGELRRRRRSRCCTSTASRRGRARGPAAASAAASACRSVERKPYRRSPYAPFRTTTLQQEASRKLGFTAKYTMSVAQRLYENGYITYMRTDSITLSQTAIDAARNQARELYGAEYVPDAPRTYASKVKNAQEAHEAIRPAGDRFRTPQEAQRSGLKGDELRLYDLIWKRTVACQMKDATGESVSVQVAGHLQRPASGPSSARPARSSHFYGFLKAYVESNDDQAADRDDQERRLPALAESDPLTALRLGAAEHATRPPARYTEASPGQGARRPGDRPAVHLREHHRHDPRPRLRVQEGHRAGALLPRVRGRSTLLERHFGQLVDYAFTAQMEDALDEIARGEAERVPWLRRFYFGDATAARATVARGRTAHRRSPFDD